MLCFFNIFLLQNIQIFYFCDSQLCCMALKTKRKKELYKYIYIYASKCIDIISAIHTLIFWNRLRFIVYVKYTLHIFFKSFVYEILKRKRFSSLSLKENFEHYLSITKPIETTFQPFFIPFIFPFLNNIVHQE